MKRLAGLLALTLLAGCAYYNGMYNANRLARAAEKAEREGRTFEAASLWGQVGVKADTMLARHADSKWGDDALLLRGKAYQRLGDCNGAITTLRHLLEISTDSMLTEEASFLMGRCYQSLGNTEEASHAFQRLVNSADPVRRREALYQYGRSLRLGGRFDEALDFLQRTDDPRSRGERATALAGIGRVEEAVVLSDSLIAAADTAAPWDSLLAVLGRHDSERATQLTDRLVAMPQATPGQRARWLFADGERLIQTDTTRGTRRVIDAVELATDGPVGPNGRMLLLRQRMLRMTSLDSLRALRSELDDLLQSSGSTGIQMGRYLRGTIFVLESADSAKAGTAAPDLRLFLAAETARDSLDMPRLAGELFRQVAAQYAASPYAAKALLALGGVDPSSADSADALLAANYPDNPYVLAARGEDASGFAVLEDSLFRFAASLRRTTRPTTRTTPASPGSRLPQN